MSSAPLPDTPAPPALRARPADLTSARVIADSVSYTSDARLTTILATMPRIIATELHRHRALSCCAGSSRAIKTEKMIKQVVETPFVPDRFPNYNPGMQPQTWLSPDDPETADAYWFEVDEWLRERDIAVEFAQQRLDRKRGKEIVNRGLEQFAWYTVLISATTWDNFFTLRCSPSAQRQIMLVAYDIRAAYEASTPTLKFPGEWHLPLVGINPQDDELSPRELIQVSTGRSARTSYLNHEGIRDVAGDLRLYGDCKRDRHWSPFEHPAQAQDEPRGSGNYWGWTQLRELEERGATP